ncbi:serine/threonine-protein kinase [Streptomyces sp. NPDC093795]|uniref:serine/threonine-protein kinase n=1 Tax=Streptomyces sp. NPDC093795 TaxID=3366051 RepID=UPI0037F8396B
MTGEARVGRVVGGRYRLVEGLASGGFGRVWAAYDEALGVDVAVKEIWLPPAGSDEEHRERVARATREARNAAKLRDHPHIVAVHDVVVENGVPWTVMRLVDGCSLEERLRAEGPLPAPRVAEVAGALLKALGAAHARGIVHRDVKPANVMLARDGQVLLTDFGISVHQTDTALTSTGGVIGSAEYMAPERLNGVDEAAGDLFSLGATLYQAVEGVSPFRRETPTATLAAVALAQAPPPERAGALTPLITRLMAKEPGDRPTVTTALDILRGGRSTATITEKVAHAASEAPSPRTEERGELTVTKPSGLRRKAVKAARNALRGGGPITPASSRREERGELTVTNRSRVPLKVIVDGVWCVNVQSGDSNTVKVEAGVHNVRCERAQATLPGHSEPITARVGCGSTVQLFARTQGRHVLLSTEPSHTKPKMPRGAGLAVGLIGFGISLATLILGILTHRDTLAGDGRFVVNDGGSLPIAVTLIGSGCAAGSFLLQIGYRVAGNRAKSFDSALGTSLLLTSVCVAVTLGLWIPLT